MLRPIAFLVAILMAAPFLPAAEPAQPAAANSSVAPPRSPLRPIVRAGNTLYISGQAGYLPGTTIMASGGFEGEVRAAIENVRVRLETEKATLAHVVQCTVYLKDISKFDVMNNVYRTFFSQNPPARTTVQVAALPKPEMNIEIACIAVDGVDR
jgi:2-iminobutanoate/2-iminopropanoate deaminase